MASRRVKRSRGSQVIDLSKRITIETCNLDRREVRCRFKRGGSFVIRGMGPLVRDLRIVSSPATKPLPSKERDALLKAASRALREAHDAQRSRQLDLPA